LSSAFYPNKRLLAQSSRTLVCQDHPAAHSPRNLYRRHALGTGHHRLHPDQYPQSKAFCLDGYCRPDLCQNYQYFINELLLQNTRLECQFLAGTSINTSAGAQLFDSPKTTSFSAPKTDVKPDSMGFRNGK